MKSKGYKQPEDHYEDNPADETPDYNGPEIDYQIHSSPAGNGDLNEVAAAAENLYGAYQKRKAQGSRSAAASKMMED